jgi:Cu-processing system ATP-binding protein
LANTIQAPAEQPGQSTRSTISVRGVSRHFGAIHAVDGVDLDIQSGEVFGLIGHNGAGKTTLFKMLLGLLPVSSGDIRIDGAPVNGRGFRDVRRRIGYLPENVVLYDNLSGLETLKFFARLKGMPHTDCSAILARVGLQDAADRRVRGYSKGMRQRLGFAQALIGDPAILFLDEPTNGLDPNAIRNLYQILHDLRSQGVTIVLTSHILAEIQERVDRLAIMANGRIQSLGTVQALREQLGLPVRFTLSPVEGQQTALQQQLSTLPDVTIAPSGAQLHLQCPRAAKLNVLQALGNCGAALHDVQMHEPSLEDVFFGLAEVRT